MPSWNTELGKLQRRWERTESLWNKSRKIWSISSTKKKDNSCPNRGRSALGFLRRIQCVMSILFMHIYLDQLSKLENKWPWKSWDSRPKKRRWSEEGGDTTPPKRTNTIILIRLLLRVKTYTQTQLCIRDNLACWICSKMSSRKLSSNNQETLTGTKVHKTKNKWKQCHPKITNLKKAMT